MILLGNFLLGIATVLGLAFQLLIFLIIAAAIISWVNADPNNMLVRIIRESTDPFLRPIRRYLPAKAIDFSPLVLILIIYFLNMFIVGSLTDYATSLRVYGR